NACPCAQVRLFHQSAGKAAREGRGSACPNGATARAPMRTLLRLDLPAVNDRDGAALRDPEEMLDGLLHLRPFVHRLPGLPTVGLDHLDDIVRRLPAARPIDFVDLVLGDAWLPRGLRLVDRLRPLTVLLARHVVV